MNNGWGNLYNSRAVRLVLRRKKNEGGQEKVEYYKISLGIDSRNWSKKNHEDVTTSFNVLVPNNIPTNNGYEVFFSLPDPS